MEKPVVDPKRTVAVVCTNEAWPEDGYTSPGSVFIDNEKVYKDHLLFACPGCGLMGSIPISPPPKQDHSWMVVSGDPLKPETLTLAPSIDCVGCCKWHGHLVDGLFKSC